MYTLGKLQVDIADFLIKNRATMLCGIRNSGGGRLG